MASHLIHGDAYEEDDEDGDNHHVWEKPVQRTLDITENEKGEIVSVNYAEQQNRKKRLREDYGGVEGVVEKEMVRFVYVIVDFSSAMEQADLKPSRKIATYSVLQEFIKEFFDQNPISQLGLVVAHNNIAEKATELSGNPQQQVDRLKYMVKSTNKHGGSFSLQNSLRVANTALAMKPPHGRREVLVLMGSIATVDAGDIHTECKDLEENNVRVSFISLSAEVFACKRISQSTQGTYTVVLDNAHFKTSLLKHTKPVPVQATAQSKTQRRWIKMGFPKKEVRQSPTLCACHVELKYEGFVCPRCKFQVCEVPTQCPVCGLQLVFSAHLARSYHHLFAVPYFHPISSSSSSPPSSSSSSSSSPSLSCSTTDTEMKGTDSSSTHTCASCLVDIKERQSIRSQCPRCKSIFCLDCDELIHQSLHNCPGCLSRPPPNETPALSPSPKPSPTPTATTPLS
mmetsp:Transcript_9063/g.17352  ORF Transcript_9063/g.17352 Transcript_9063/m.17352 type:complete len:455 (+) Transcript_9063:44-1408(+)